MVLAALFGFLARLAVGIVLALVLALLIALIRDDSSFTESFRIGVLSVGCLMLLIAGAGHSPSMNTGSIGPGVAGRFPKLVPQMSRTSTMQVSPTALFVLTALTLLAIGFALG